VVDTTLIPANVRVRARRKGLFAGQATFRRCVSKTEWGYGFKVALSVSPEGVVTAFGLERLCAKTLGGLLTRLAAKMAAHTCGQMLNSRLGRPLRHLAALLV